MVVVTVLLFCYRLPSLTDTEFHTYIEQTHVPLVKSLLGVDYPLSHTRYYTKKNSGFVVGSPSSTDADLVAIITYESMEHMQRSMSVRRSDGVRNLIEADEDRFMDRARVKVIVVEEGDVGRSVR